MALPTTANLLVPLAAALGAAALLTLTALSPSRSDSRARLHPRDAAQSRGPGATQPFGPGAAQSLGPGVLLAGTSSDSGQKHAGITRLNE